MRIKFGKVDASSEVAYVEHASVMLNSSFGVSPTIFALPTYPDPATSLNFFWEPQDWASWGIGLYDGEGLIGVPTGARPFRTAFLGGSNVFLISETLLANRHRV